MPTLINRFRRAVNFIKFTRNIESNKEIALALHVTPSYLSQVLSGKRQLTPQMAKAFEVRFAVDLNDPMSYTDFSEMAVMEGFTAKTFGDLLTKMRSMLIQRETIIRSQQDMIVALMKERDLLMALIYQDEAMVIENQK